MKKDNLQNKSVTLRSKLIEAQFITAFAVIFICISVFIVNDYYETKNNIQGRINSLANVLSHNISAAVNFEDKEEIKSVIESIKSEKEISNVLVFNKNEILLDALSPVNEKTNRAKFKKNLNKVSWRKGTKYFLAVKIKEDTMYLGYLVFEVDLLYYKKIIYKYLILILLVSLVAIAVCFIMANIVQHIISDPVNSMLESIRKIKETKSYSTSIALSEKNKSSIAEFFELSTSFNEMLILIEESTNEVNKMNENLEALVDKRTSELQQERIINIQSSKLAALGEMAAGIAHEINNPLTVVNGKTRHIQKYLKKNNMDIPFITKATDDIQRVVLRIEKIVKGLKIFSRDASADPYEKTSVDELIKETLIFCEKKYEKHYIKLEYLPSSLPSNVSCRKTELSQVILNLLNNAFDEVINKESPWVNIVVIVKSNKIEIQIIDSGKGISLEVQEKMFNPFFTTKDVGKGTGLGLSMARSVIEEMKGKLSIDNHCHNTKFVIELDLYSDKAIKDKAS